MNIRRILSLMAILLLAGTALAKSKKRIPVPPKLPTSPPPCIYTMQEGPHPCSGVPYPTPINPPKVRVCNACLQDRDCREAPGGRCIRTYNGPCAGDGSRACAYPGDECYSEGMRGADCAICVNFNGRATCGLLPAMPPSMPHGPNPAPAAQ